MLLFQAHKSGYSTPYISSSMWSDISSLELVTCHSLHPFTIVAAKDEETTADLSPHWDTYWCANWSPFTPSPLCQPKMRRPQLTFLPLRYLLMCQLKSFMDRGPHSDREDDLDAMCNVTIQYRVGQVAQPEEMCTHGCKIWFLVLPDMLRYTPMTKRNQCCSSLIQFLVLCGPPLKMDTVK